MLRPNPRLRFPILAIATSTLLLGLSACDRDVETPTTTPAPTPEPAPITITAPPIVLDRVGLLTAVDTAASAYATGQAPAGQETLVGRRFTIRQAFGCGGPTPASATTATTDTSRDGLASWTSNAEARTQRLSLIPGDWTETTLIAGEEATWEAAEGFWITRPWARTETCPQTRPDQPMGGPVAVSSAQTVGLAAVFEADGSRLGRRNGRAYTFTLRGAADQSPLPHTGGYRLVLEGRFTAFPDGRAIRCRATSADQRPVCIAAVQLDRVGFENTDGSLISEWRVG